MAYFYWDLSCKTLTESMKQAKRKQWISGTTINCTISPQIQPATVKWEGGYLYPTFITSFPKHPSWRFREYNVGFWSFSRVGVFSLPTITEVTFLTKPRAWPSDVPSLCSPKLSFFGVFSRGSFICLDRLDHLRASQTIPKSCEGSACHKYSCRVYIS